LRGSAAEYSHGTKVAPRAHDGYSMSTRGQSAI
jgi:hypothetical protein